MNTVLKFLTQPYPFDIKWSSNLKRNALIGAFVAFFLIAFQPFGTNNWVDEWKSVKLLGYGIVSFVMPTMLLALLYLLQKREKVEETWRVWKEIVFMILLLAAIAFGNMMYSNCLSIVSFTAASYLGFFISVIGIGIFPISAGILIRYFQMNKKNQSEAAILEGNLQDYQSFQRIINNEEITLVAENEKDTIFFNINDLLYIESADNYSNIVFLKQQKIQKELLRGTLKRFENQLLPYPFVLRCHRSYIINLKHVENVSGNAQGYRMNLKNSDIVIPVARNYGSTILNQLKNESF